MDNTPIVVVDGPSGPSVITNCAYCQATGCDPLIPGHPCRTCGGAGMQSIQVK